MHWVRQNAFFLVLLLLLIVLALLGRGLVSSLASSPPPSSEPSTSTPSVSLQELRKVADQAMVSQQTVAEVRSDRFPDDIWGQLGAREELILLVYGDVKAGFDPADLEASDFWFDGNRVQLHLPAPVLLDAQVDSERSHIVFHHKSPFLNADPTFQEEALESAEDAIRQAAVEAGLLEWAARYGQLSFENYLRSRGFEDVRIAVN
ncbi:MAG: DUF4230 domain-containing protein [Chloroflexota bacterium]|nr:DUF4230 domain-containing protein [Chloroflexota bacterium]